MNKNSNKSQTNDFVARDIKNNRICVSGRSDRFKATKSNNKWENGYPKFEDLMDNFSEVKDVSEIQKLSKEARSSLIN